MYEKLTQVRDSLLSALRSLRALRNYDHPPDLQQLSTEIQEFIQKIDETQQQVRQRPLARCSDAVQQQLDAAMQTLDYDILAEVESQINAMQDYQSGDSWQATIESLQQDYSDLTARLQHVQPMIAQVHQLAQQPDTIRVCYQLWIEIREYVPQSKLSQERVNTLGQELQQALEEQARRQLSELASSSHLASLTETECHRHREALRQLRNDFALLTAPDQEPLLDELEQGCTALEQKFAEQQIRLMALAKLEQAEQALAAARLDMATRLLGEAQQCLPATDDQLQAVQQQLAASQAEARQHMAQAQQAYEAGLLNAAHEALEVALERDSEDETLDAWQELLTARRQEQLERAQEAYTLQATDLAAAVYLWDAVCENFQDGTLAVPDQPVRPLTDWRDEARQQLEACRAKAREYRAQAQQAYEEGMLNAAHEALEVALERDSEDEALHALQTKLTDRIQEQQKRALEAYALQATDLAAAVYLWDAVCENFQDGTLAVPDQPVRPLTDWRDEARQQLEARWAEARRAEARQHMAQAQQAYEAGLLNAAHEALEVALELDSEDEALHALQTKLTDRIQEQQKRALEAYALQATDLAAAVYLWDDVCTAFQDGTLAPPDQPDRPLTDWRDAAREQLEARQQLEAQATEMFRSLLDNLRQPEWERQKERDIFDRRLGQLFVLLQNAHEPPASEILTTIDTALRLIAEYRSAFLQLYECVDDYIAHRCDEPTWQERSDRAYAQLTSARQAVQTFAANNANSYVVANLGNVLDLSFAYITEEYDIYR